MDLGSSTFDTPGGTPPGRSTIVLLEELETLVELRRDAATAEAATIVDWVRQNTVTDPAGAATLTDRGLDTGLPVAGEGAPLVSDFALVELSSVLGRSLDSGRSYVGQVVEVAFRLPLLWQRVLDGAVPVWRALQVADRTRTLPSDAAAHVDRHLAHFAAGCTWAQVDRLVAEALVRFDPEAAEEQRRKANESRHFDIDTTNLDYDGVVHVEGTLDAADALDLEAAVARRAEHLADLGSTESLDVRRAIAVGEIARDDLTLDLATEERTTGTGRTVELRVHLTPESLVSASTTTEDHPTDGVSANSTNGGSSTNGPAPNPVARFGTTQTPISPEQVREWCGGAAKIIIRPIIDLTGCRPVDSYEIPDRLREQVTERDHTCRFPNCPKPAVRCDLDHVIEHARGGPTCPAI